MLSLLSALRWPLTLWSIWGRRNTLRDLSAIRDLRPDERLELASHDDRFGRLLTTTALVAVSGLAVWGWGSGWAAKARVGGLQRDLDSARQVVAQRTVERDQARDVARGLQASLEGERTVRGQCEARWSTSQAMCARVIGEGARRTETRVRREAARRRGAIDAITTPPATVADPVPSTPAPDPRGLLLGIQAAPDAVPDVPAAEAADQPAAELRGLTDPGP
jgi:hypothetical protein